MKITRVQLRQIIREEIDKAGEALNEQSLLALPVRVLAFGMYPFIGDTMVGQMFRHFLMQKTSTFTAKDLYPETKETLEAIIKYAQRRGSQQSGGRRLRKGRSISFGNEKDWKGVAKMFEGEVTGLSDFMSGGALSALKSDNQLEGAKYALGHFTIKQTGSDTFEISDVYDFNSIRYLFPEGEIHRRAIDEDYFKSKKNFLSFAKDAAFGKLRIRRKGKYVPVKMFSTAGIEHLAAFYQGLFNYKGFPVKISLKIEPKKTKVAAADDEYDVSKEKGWLF